MATALIIDDAYGQLAWNYYERFSGEPCGAGGSVIVDNKTTIPNTSLDTTLQAILAGNYGPIPRPDIVLVTHGNERGLTMRLFPHHRTDSRTDNLQVLMDQSLSRENKAKQLSITATQLDSLTDKIKQVRNLFLGFVEFRGCNIGKNLANLTTLRDLLGAASVTGTDVKSDYGWVVPHISRSAAEFDQWLKFHGATATVTTLQNGRVGFLAKLTAHAAVLTLVAETKDALPDWLYGCIDPLGFSPLMSFQPWMRLKLPIHYLHLAPPILPYTVTTFPGENPAYLSHIQKS
jgi:hypothetical protein